MSFAPSPEILPPMNLASNSGIPCSSNATLSAADTQESRAQQTLDMISMTIRHGEEVDDSALTILANVLRQVAQHAEAEAMAHERLRTEMASGGAAGASADPDADKMV